MVAVAVPKRRPRVEIPEEMAHATSILPSFLTRMFLRLVPRSSLTSWQLMPPWRRFACHIAPAIAALGVTFLIWQLAEDRGQPIKFDTAIIPPIAKPGQTVRFELRRAPCDSIIHRWITDSKQHVYDLSDVNHFAADDDGEHVGAVVVREFSVPLSANEGPALYHAVITRWCNTSQKAIWPITIRYNLPFTVDRGGL